MEKVRLVLAESNEEERVKLEQHIATWEEVELLAVASNGQEAIKIIGDNKPQVVISGLALKNSCGMELCEKIKEESDAKVIMLSSAFSDASIKLMVESGVDHYMERPFDPEVLRKRINMLAEPKNTKAAEVLANFPRINRKLDERISNIFLTIGIPAHIKGYTFAREGIKMYVERFGQIDSITKNVYPSIAKNFKSSPSKVERAIRHAIEVGWNRGRMERINEIFGVKVFDQKDKPTNSEFIALIADKLILEG